MENNYSTLNALEGLIKIHKKKSLALLQSKATKNITASHCDIVLQMIEELKEVEKENARLIWKEGYISSCFEVQEFFGINENPHLGESDLSDIDRNSFEFIKTKFN
jgi:hypothetical protein